MGQPGKGRVEIEMEDGRVLKGNRSNNAREFKGRSDLVKRRKKEP